MTLGARLELALKSGVGYNQAVEGLGSPADSPGYLPTADWLRNEPNTGRVFNVCYPARTDDATCSSLMQLEHVVLWDCGSLPKGKSNLKHFNAVKQKTLTDVCWVFVLSFCRLMACVRVNAKMDEHTPQKDAVTLIKRSEALYLILIIIF